MKTKMHLVMPGLWLMLPADLTDKQAAERIKKWKEKYDRRILYGKPDEVIE